jgi:hypothetical protein
MVYFEAGTGCSVEPGHGTTLALELTESDRRVFVGLGADPAVFARFRRTLIDIDIAVITAKTFGTFTRIHTFARLVCHGARVACRAVGARAAVADMASSLAHVAAEQILAFAVEIARGNHVVGGGGL